MTNQEAIRLIRCAQAEIEWEQPMEYAAAFDKAIEALEATSAKWISVKERPPKSGEKVLILDKYGHVSGAVLIQYDTEHFFYPFGHNLSNGYVTHWMPTPEESEEDEM